MQTTRSMLGYPPPMRTSDGSKIRVVRCSGGHWAAPHAVDASTVPLTLQSGDWPHRHEVCRERSAALEHAADVTPATASRQAASGSHGEAILPCSAAVGQQPAGLRQTGNLGPRHQSEPVRACKRSHVTDDGGVLVTASAGYSEATTCHRAGQLMPAALPARCDASDTGDTAQPAQQKYPQGREQSGASIVHGRQTAAAATARIAASGSARSVRRVWPGFEGAAQEQREAAEQNPAWALVQVTAHCTDVEVTDRFRAW